MPYSTGTCNMNFTVGYKYSSGSPTQSIDQLSNNATTTDINDTISSGSPTQSIDQLSVTESHVLRTLKSRLMSNTYARCPMEKSKGHWIFRLSNGSIIVHWTFACPLDPMDKWNFHRTFAFSVGQLTCL